MNKKIYICFALVACFIFTSIGCAKKTTVPSITTINPSSTEGGDFANSSIAKVGDEVNGYIELEYGSWVEQQTAPSSDGSILATAMAVSNKYKASISMITFNNTKNVDDLVSYHEKFLEEHQAKGIITTDEAIGGHACKQITAYYDDGLYFNCWYFVEDNGKVHYISAEYNEAQWYTYGLCVANYHFANEEFTSGKFNDYLIVHSDTELDMVQEDALVEASAENPAALGDWIETVMYNNLDGKLYTVYYQINSTLRGDEAKLVVDEYTNKGTIKINLTDPSLEYAYYNYVVYYPKSFKTVNGNISKPQLKFSIDYKESGYIGLSDSVEIPMLINMSDYGYNYFGLGVFAIPVGYDDIYIKRTCFDGTTQKETFVDPF